MHASWSILYRGLLSSCNYECSYCPFAKNQNTREELRMDSASLARFAQWVRQRSESIGLLFTPWGEALVHRYYQEILGELSHEGNVWRVAIQTNLSGRLDWLAGANPQKLALWCTFHPTQTSIEQFLNQTRQLDEWGFVYSVGVVGTKEAFEFIESLRSRLPDHVYLWVNALKRSPHYYSAEEINWLTQIDPHFPLTHQHYSSLGRACSTGNNVFSVDGNGDMRRCHFVKDLIGNIYHEGFEKSLRPRPCPAQTCGCHIGYVHMETLSLETVFGERVLERVPKDFRFQSRHRTASSG